VLSGDHTESVRCVQFNPKYMMMASACKNMAFWLPSVDEDSWISSQEQLKTYYNIDNDLFWSCLKLV